MHAVGVLFAIVILLPGFFWIAKFLFSRVVLRMIGRRAINKTPGEIHLTPAQSFGPSNPASQELLGLGFEEVGLFSVAEMPGVQIRLFVEPRAVVSAHVYAHPRAGSWVELVTWYEDGTSAYFSTLRPTGRNARPGNLRVNAPGASVAALYDRMLAERPAKAMRPLSARNAVVGFEQRYAEEMAWRKAGNVTAEEVAAVARRRGQR